MDHETAGAKEWLLPGYGRPTSKSRGETTRTVADQARITLSKDSIRKEIETQNPQSSYAAVTAAPVANSIGRGRGASRATRATRGRVQARRAYSNTAASRQSSNLLRDSPAKSNWRAGSEPSAIFNLPTSFGSFKYEFFGVARSTLSGKSPAATQGRHEVFEEISRRTGAYVKPPSYTDKVIQLWGKPQDVALAIEMIERLLAKCNSFAAAHKRTEWAKINAYSANKEMGVDFKERRENILLFLRKEPESPSAFPEQLFFLWPNDGPPIKESLGKQLEALDIIRAKFGCHLYLPKNAPDYICALGHSHDTMRQIAQLLRTKWSETVANSHVRSKAYILEPPETLRDKIVVENNTLFAKAFLHGKRVKSLSPEQWQNRRTLIQTKNNTHILSALSKSLQGVSFVRGHLRMRVNLGSFVLDEYHMPKNDKVGYSFEEFREMLLHEQTKGRLIPGLRVGQDELLARCFMSTDLLEPYESTSCSLKNAEPAYSVNFEFLGSNNALLRLEAEFARSPGAQEYEVTQRRWLRPRKSGQSRDRRPPLQIGVIDFERADWQLEIKSLEFYETSSIDAALKSFSHSIGFRRTTTIGDISAQPKRKVIFPSSAPVSRFVEKTSIRYRLKGTKYILEIARYDEYSRLKTDAFQGQALAPALVTGEICDVPSTSWGASIFNSNWDNLMGEQANLSVGHSARHSPELHTFFPPRMISNSDDKSEGFWEFIGLVKRVAEVLGPAQPRSSSENTARIIQVSTESSMISAATKSQPPSNGSSPKLEVKGLAGMLDADLGTLF
ncbi:hypothetical protein BDV27DRAFT_172493 [Aspergillus caelatus]|uniref:DUF7905 domain-containing protein n=2 Tax=Aspergillus subgen. Circumdati TaxID=2720871 RepID=A0A5N7A4U3_9EURO|nr:uncharacterized protein BDV27DRAFT_172493 [Aspergillus caelatus]KAE8364209.1 hypothetical protein BDV27DRAFT_172493 [Aspergillus caelatus]KAE8416711.1 hypothetical protein BDV36DRAFT_284364 [Aspergillus pseudocaelatus]